MMHTTVPELPAVGIGILNWNGKKWLEQFLPSVCKISYPNFKIYVIDNASADDSVIFLQANYPQVQIIQTGDNHGFAGGYNRGFAQIGEPLLLMLNSDVEVTEGFLQPMVDMMLADESIAVCQSKILSWNQKNQFEYAGAAGGMMDYLGYAFCRGRIFDAVEEDKDQYPSGEIFWATGACCLIRRSAYMQVAGLYEYFFMHFEEIDLCWRLKAVGFKIMYCKESVVYHVGGATLQYQSPNKTYLNFRNNLVMVVKNSGVLYLLWWLPVRFILDMLAMLRLLLQRDPENAAAVVKAYFGLLIWLWQPVDRKHATQRSLTIFPVVLKKSIVWLYYAKKKKTFEPINCRNK